MSREPESRQSLTVEVEENPNCDYMPMLLYETHRPPAPIYRVHLEEPGRPAGVYEVTGWSSEGDGTPTPAEYAPVSDSGQAVVHLVFGGDWGIRFRPEGSTEEWSIDSHNQWGEPYVMLTDESDVLL